MPVSRFAALPLMTLPLIAVLIAAPALARPGGGMGPMGPGWGSGLADPSWSSPRRDRGDDPREGKVDSDTFAAKDAAGTLGHGMIAVTTLAGSTASGSDGAAYEAAIVDQLVKAGYDTTQPDPEGGQIAEIRVIRDTLVPEEAPHKPVSGEMSVGVSNRGSAVGLGIAVDLSKPRKALVSTRLEARVRDRASGEPLWEGHATIATREGDDHWSEQAIATRLAAALFARFPEATAGRVASR